MKKDLEYYLAKRIRRSGQEGGAPARDVIEEMKREGLIESEKQAWWTLEKWSNKGLYEYGVCLDLGWLTKEGIKVLIDGAPPPQPPPRLEEEG